MRSLGQTSPRVGSEAFRFPQPNPAIVLRAERDPMPGVPDPGPHQLYRRPRISVEPRPLGRLRRGQVRVRMLLAGICGTDLHMIRSDPETGYLLGSAPLEIVAEGRVIGHEGVGEVVGVGDGVTTIAPGDFVTFESLLACQVCSACRRGWFNHCREAKLVGGQVDGLFRELVDLPARLAHDVTDLARTSAGLRAAACIEPAACAFVAATRAGVCPGDRVVVFGGGPIGLFAAMLCREAFGARVEVVEPVASRRELVGSWCDRSYAIEEFFEVDDQDEIDVVIEASGDLDNVNRALGRLGSCARIALLARCGKPLRLDKLDHVITNGISVVGSRGHLGGAFDQVLRLVRAGRLPLDRAVTGVVDGLGGIERELLSRDPFEHRHTKVLAAIGNTLG